ncbi:hypothetical protein NST89_03510 [Caldifermentibacillus hisashii]|uniref:hypothetical protein n=1 Tax=Caldifermentibacillus hisashii TaxID=996558 RepID=UPI003134E66C
MSVVAKKWRFPHKKDDEKEFRRQKSGFSVQKRRRERVSSPKSGDFRHKMTTRRGFVAKKWVLRPKATTIRDVVAKKVGSPSKSDDENGCRHQKSEFSATK